MKIIISSYKEICKRSFKEIGLYFVNLYNAKRLIAIGALIIVLAIILLIYLINRLQTARSAKFEANVELNPT